MNKIYKHSFQSFLFLGTFFLTAVTVQAQQVSAVPSGPFNQATSWVNGVVPTEDWNPLTISVNSEITKDDSFSWGSKVTVNGVFDVNGSFSVDYGGAEVYGVLSVLTDFQVGGGLVFGSVSRVKVGGSFIGSGRVDFGDEAVVEIGGDFSIGGGSNANIRGDLVINGALIGDGSSFVIHKGAIVTVSRVDANMAIDVREGGTLIVEN